MRQINIVQPFDIPMISGNEAYFTTMPAGASNPAAHGFEVNGIDLNDETLDWTLMLSTAETDDEYGASDTLEGQFTAHEVVEDDNQYDFSQSESFEHFLGKN